MERIISASADLLEPKNSENNALKACRFCLRTFNPVSLDRHEKICEKNKKYTNRTVFKSFLQRSKDLGIAPIEKDEEKKLTSKEQSIKCNVESPKKGFSSLKHITSGYHQCPFCQRYFNQKAADRHISWCKEQKNRLPKTPTNSEALERLQARVKYQAPQPRKNKVHDISCRLVKSAESVRKDPDSCTFPAQFDTPRVFRSSPINHNRLRIKQSILKSASASNNNTVMESKLTKSSVQELENKKSVKFKETFSVYDKDKNKHLDILKALRIHLSQLSTSEQQPEGCILRYIEHEAVEDDSFSAARCVDNSQDSFHNDKHLPRFCYNCGTKYPIISAKYCCECGVQRFIFANSH